MKKLIKELALIFGGVALMMGGLAMILRAELLNSVILLGIILMGIGMACFGYFIKDELKGGGNKWKKIR